MKIIEASWEKRNLGRDCFEVTLDKSDLLNCPKIIEELSSPVYQKCYLVLKMPVGNLEFLHSLEDFGFRFMENQFLLSKDLSEYESPVILNNSFVSRVEIKKEVDAWEEIIDLISVDMFNTDRIYLDPQLENSVSSKRYKNWIRDLVSNPDAHLFATYENDKIIGFGIDIWNEKKKIVRGLLGGIFSDKIESGYSFYLWDQSLKFNKNHGFKKFVTSISSNNARVLDIYMYFGYKIYNQYYVLRKIYN